MNKNNNTIPGILLCLLFLSFQVHAAQEFPLYDFNGNAASLDQYTGKGKWLVVMFWASDCLICNKEAHQYVSFHTQHKDHDAEVLGISMDGLKLKNDAQNFIKEHDIPFTNLIGEPETIAALYYELTGDIWYGTPTFLVFAPNGKLKASQAGAVPPNLIESYINKHTN